MKIVHKVQPNQMCWPHLIEPNGRSEKYFDNEAYYRVSIFSWFFESLYTNHSNHSAPNIRDFLTVVVRLVTTSDY